MKRISLSIAIAASSLGLCGQTQQTPVIWSAPDNVRPQAVNPEDVKIIREADLPEGGVMSTYYSSLNFANINEYGVTWAHDDKLATHVYWTDSDMAYVHNLSTIGDAWVPAYVEGDILWVPNGANILLSANGTLYQLITAVVNMKTNSMEARTGIKFTMNADRTELVMEPNPDKNNVLGFYTMSLAEGKIIQAFSKITLTEMTDVAVTPPEDAEYKRYTYTTMLGGWREWENRSWMAFDGQDVYIQGLEWINPEGWVKGSLMSDGSIRIPSGQFLSINGNYPVYYFAGIYEGNFLDETAKVTPRSAFFLNHDEATGGYSMVGNECFVSGKDMSWGFPVIDGKFIPFDVQPGTPKAAEDLEWDPEHNFLTFHIPMTDTDGNAIDRFMLRYSIYVNGQRHTFTPENSPLVYESFEEMPANASYYIYSFDTEYMFGRNPDDIYALIINTDEPIESLGVGLTYDVRGDEHRSEMAEMTLSGLDLITSDTRKPVSYYSLDGRQLKNPDGICIVRYDDGSVEKRIVRNSR